MANGKSHRLLPYVIGTLFGLLVSACVGTLVYLVCNVILEYFDILPPESIQVSTGVGLLFGIIAWLAQLWEFATHNILRPRRSAQIAARPPDNSNPADTQRARSNY